MPDETHKTDIMNRVTAIMRRDLKLGPDIVIDARTPFFGGEADIDSLDVLLLMTSIEREFAIKIPNEEVSRQIFENLTTLCDYLESRVRGSGVTTAVATPASASPDPLRRLPHQPPFRFVTRLTHLEEGKSAEGIWSLSGKEDFFRGHFPGRPIVPGVLIAEALAQLCGVAKNNGGGDGRLAQVDVRFERAVTPPAEIQLQTRVVRTLGTVIQYDVRASWEGSVVARGLLMLSLPPPKAAESQGESSAASQPSQ